MKKHFRKIIVLSILTLLILGNPSEKRFLLALQEDYGSVHQGMNLGVEELKQMGTSSYRSYIFWSSYEYAFGSIQVKYVGIVFTTFYLGSGSTQSIQQEKTQHASL